MKKILGLLAILLSLIACSTSKTSEKKAATARMVYGQVMDSLNSSSYTILLDYVTPRRMKPQFLTSGYRVKIDGDTITSFLPYFGVAYRADFNGRDRSPLDFRAPILSYKSEQVKQDYFRIKLSTRHEMEIITYQIEVFSNGKATLDVISSDREGISFSGNINLAE